MGVGGFPTLDHVTEAGSGDYLGMGHHAMAVALSESVDPSRGPPPVHQIATRQIPQGGVGVPQVFGSFLPWSDLTSTQPGTLREENEQRVPGLELNFGMYEDTPARQAHQQHSGEASNMDIAQQREILIFFEGEDDAVTITGSDLEGLEPTSFLSNNIIDFYMKFLERRLPSEDRGRFYFFNSFFFTKLLGDSSSIAEIPGCGADFDRVRRWTGEVNLFEKDYVFIPILRSSHWSLIIVCHLNSLTNTPDWRRGSPCVYHLDPVEGKHESFEDQIRSYMLQACMERYRDSEDRDRIILALACEMKYIRTKVPQQGNGHDCGVYLLHYVEVFLRESTSPHFNFGSASNLWGPNFAEEASAKRLGILSLIFELSNRSVIFEMSNRWQEQVSRPVDIQPRPQPGASDTPNPCAGRKCAAKPSKEQSKQSKKWKDEETSLLLKRMVEGGRIRKGTKGASHWDLIAEDMKAKLGFTRTEGECRRRYDTLLKAYKKVKKTGKPFSDIRGKEQVELNLATPLTDEWYRAIDTICVQRDSGNAKARKRTKRNTNDEDDAPSCNLAPPPTPSGCGDERIPSRKQVAIPGFSALRDDLRVTLLNLIQFSFKDRDFRWRRRFQLELVCRKLAVVEDRKPWEIRRNIYELAELKLVDFERITRWNDGGNFLELDNIWLFGKFVEKLLRKNPDFDICVRLWEDVDIVSFPQVPALSSWQRIRALSLYRCSKLEQADLSCFPELRSLVIYRCHELRLVTGWEVVTKLGWLEIEDCESYVDFPPAQHFTSLREFKIDIGGKWLPLSTNWVPDFRQCVQLRRLDIWRVGPWALDNIDLSMLRFLEDLTLSKCHNLTTIQGLSGLHSLTTLDLSFSTFLRRVPELGCLKALTHLDMSGSGVEEISGVQELYRLTSLRLFDCSSLKMLPFLGHLKALASLNIIFTGVEEIPGVQDLDNLETLACAYSKLKWLPDLCHLPRLQWVLIRGTPLCKMDSSSFYFGKDTVDFNSSNVERKVFLTEISDISDTE